MTIRQRGKHFTRECESGYRALYPDVNNTSDATPRETTYETEPTDERAHEHQPPHEHIDPTHSRGPTKAENRMNKQTKGAIAAGAAALLLAGGAGTMAAWNASVDVSGSNISSGKLTLDTVANSTSWTYGDGTTPFDPANNKIVPGDTVIFTTQVTIGAEGENLEAEFDVDSATIGGSLATKISTPVVSAEIGNSAVTTVTDDNDGDVVDVVVEITLPDTADNTSQEGTLDLTNFAITLDQSV